MNKFLKYTLIALVVVGIVGVTAVSVGYAQTDDPPPRPHEALAELLGLTTEELHDLIQEGTTLEELAADAGVDLETFWEEMRDNMQDFMKERLAEALDNGDISQDQYDWMLEGIEKGYMGGGHGFGGFHGRGFYKGDGGIKPFVDEEGVRPFGGRGGFGRQGRPGGCLGMEGYDS